MPSQLIYYFFSYFSAALLMSLVLMPLLKPLSFRTGAVDRGTGRRVHSGIIPRLGGAGIFLAFVVPFAFSLTRGVWDEFHDRMTGVLIASTAVFLIGLYDDLRGARVRTKLIAEVLAAALIYAWGIRITVLSNPFGGTIVLGWLGLPVTILWIIVITNAINLIDGLDGLAAGTGLLVAATFFILSGQDTHLQLAYVTLGGALFGFLRYNFPPASIFMGDSGSLFLGFLLAATSIVSSHKAAAVATLMVPFIAFSIPIMDMLYAVLRRYYRGLPLSSPDREHIHHKLLERGLTRKKVLFILYAANIAVMLTVLVLIRRQRDLDFIAILAFFVVAVVGFRLLGYLEFLPTFREMFRGFDLGRRRKYFSYVLRRFRKGARESATADELRPLLTNLMEEFGFSAAEVRLFTAEGERTFFRYGGGTAPGEQLVLTIPLLGQDNARLGVVSISRSLTDDQALCTDELIRALSEELSCIIARQAPA